MNILVDFDRRSEDQTASNTLIIGNSGQGKSYLMKLLITIKLRPLTTLEKAHGFKSIRRIRENIFFVTSLHIAASLHIACGDFSF